MLNAMHSVQLLPVDVRACLFARSSVTWQLMRASIVGVSIRRVAETSVEQRRTQQCGVIGQQDSLAFQRGAQRITDQGFGSMICYN